MSNMNANKEMVKRMSKNHNNLRTNSVLNGGGEDPKSSAGNAAVAGKQGKKGSEDSACKECIIF